MNKHGGYIGKKMDVIDFSININPLGTSNKIKEKIKENIENLHKYPEINGQSSLMSISKHENINVENLILGNGGTELIYLFSRAIKPKKVLLIQPAFNEYKRAFDICGAEVFNYITDYNNNFEIDCTNLINKIYQIRPDVLVLVNPNNPTGGFIEKTQFTKVMYALKEVNAILFVDESFIDFSQNESFKDFIDDFKIFILRSMTKYFAVPGIRLGYGIGNSDIIKKLNNIKEPWTLNCFALSIVEDLLTDKKYIEDTKAWYKNEKEYLFNEINSIDKIHVYKSNTNYFLCKLLNSTGQIIQNKLLEKNIYIRTCEDFIGLDNTFIRFAVKKREENTRLVKALKEYLERGL